jgi:predicted phosphoribosyltransferase/dienelactone hydrolase
VRPGHYRDRREAGRALADELREYGGRDDVVVLGLPRGGVPVAYEIAAALGAPLDVVLVRKLGVPGHEELAFGALASGGLRVLNDDVIAAYSIPETTVDAVTAQQEAEIRRREQAYVGTRQQLRLAGKTAIVVDDGLATGSTMLAAVRALRKAGPRCIVVAVPVAARPTCRMLSVEADDVRCLLEPDDLRAIGLWYEDFEQVADDEVRQLLGSARARSVRRVTLEVAHPRSGGDAPLKADLTVPPSPRAVVAFAHGSGSGRASPRNRAVATVLNEAGLATLLIDLLTPAEEALDRRTGELRFDIPLLAERLGASTVAALDPELARSPLVYYGASTGAAAALLAAARRPDGVAAVVSRGGRPDLAGDALALVRAPTLLIVGGADPTVLELNRRARAELRVETRLEIVEGAGHLFEEPGALERVAELTRDWVLEHVDPARSLGAGRGEEDAA